MEKGSKACECTPYNAIPYPHARSPVQPRRLTRMTGPSPPPFRSLLSLPLAVLSRQPKQPTPPPSPPPQLHAGRRGGSRGVPLLRARSRRRCWPRSSHAQSPGPYRPCCRAPTGPAAQPPAPLRPCGGGLRGRRAWISQLLRLESQI